MNINSIVEYINRLRIEYACEQIKKKPSISNQELADLSGFTSIVSLFRNFKQYKGYSPKEFLKHSRTE
ncbi:MAG: helix-turn-helix domain-containing protein [Bacteroidaceae bacterium]|nr:helix-turn-helix domain-containing protein [Bacteroidaceae bacterium]